MSSENPKQHGSDVTGDGDVMPLVVDVDGSLIAGDLLIEGIARMLADSALNLFVLPFRLAKGRAACKRWVANATELLPSAMVLNPAVLNEIASAKSAGREVWLASASDATAVAPLAEHIGVTGFLASDGRVNLAGEAKAAALVERFGESGFDYIGNERRDLAVWKRARRAIGVGLSGRLQRDVRALDPEARFLSGPGGDALDYLWALRPHQWVKNVLVFVPLVAAHEAEADRYLVAVALFVALSACASGTYLFNDLLDLPHDRRNDAKRHRPMAAGRTPLLTMIGIGTALVAGSTILGFCLSITAGLCILLYLMVTFAYSMWLKRLVLVDIVVLALLYGIRILAGAAPLSITPSPWLFAFTMFIFLALAIVKRQRELKAVLDAGRSATGGRAYRSEDLPVMAALGAASGIAAVVVLALYVQSPEVNGRYGQPEFLWLICPLLVYWLGRMVVLANRGLVDDDPVVFALRDRASWLIGVGVLAAFAAAL